ncbi:hypothetical protein KQX54_004639 [Cotesia glomerata]|uniref:Uncharacterized protein n=1 Tax=Cotesia glomerata TaxID=32391 RepID=A0AAV7J2B4_COTGL|nr:hypothetical protein KQX54_004639 [Cotesia glomerata]
MCLRIRIRCPEVKKESKRDKAGHEWNGVSGHEASGWYGTYELRRTSNIIERRTIAKDVKYRWLWISQHVLLVWLLLSARQPEPGG